ncbi:MAG TPA: lysylphosphatidylglycerol synthase transmembrane domain-containing protein [Candidatus Nanopelagicaceae bacterium]|nr:lysylphosphatidylglycerol synthase transmembrane domain-containing protein [Candidatus Nanopelagicaceae bacterium]
MSTGLARVVSLARRPWARVGIGSVVAAALLALVLTRISGHRAVYSMEHVSLPMLGLAALLAAAYVGLRAWRYRMLLGQGSAVGVIAVTAASWGAGQLLPGPGSDAAFVWFARRDLDASVSRGTGAALVARLLDMASLAVILLVSADLAGISLGRPVRVAAVVLAVILGVALLALFVRRPRRLLLGLAERMPVVGGLAARAGRALAELSSWQTLVGLSLATVGARLLAALEYYCLFLALGAHLDLWQVWLALAVRTLLFALPVQGVGGMGTSQVWWAGGLALAGLPVAAALSLGLVVQILDLVVALPEGALGWLALRVRRAVRDGGERSAPRPRSVWPRSQGSTPASGMGEGAASQPPPSPDLVGATTGFGKRD